MRCSIRLLDFSGAALVMAIVNCNDDSFYAPSRAFCERAVEKALEAEGDGASIIDFGAESSRPGASYISEEEELERLVPVIEMFRRRSSLPVSVDTRKAAVARAALEAGADMVNDISALSDDPLMGGLCAERGSWVVLMHKKGEPVDMQTAPHYDDLAGEMKAFFSSAVNRALSSGISSDRIILDPGVGFGKTLDDNLEIIRRLEEICGRDYPVMVGLSRKSFLGEICGTDNVPLDVSERLPGTLAAHAAAIMNGAGIIRVHDVKEHADLVKVLSALSSKNG